MLLERSQSLVEKLAGITCFGACGGCLLLLFLCLRRCIRLHLNGFSLLGYDLRKLCVRWTRLPTTSSTKDSSDSLGDDRLMYLLGFCVLLDLRYIFFTDATGVLVVVLVAVVVTEEPIVIFAFFAGCSLSEGS